MEGYTQLDHLINALLSSAKLESHAITKFSFSSCQLQTSYQWGETQIRGSRGRRVFAHSAGGPFNAPNDGVED